MVNDRHIRGMPYAYAIVPAANVELFTLFALWKYLFAAT